MRAIAVLHAFHRRLDALSKSPVAIEREIAAAYADNRPACDLLTDRCWRPDGELAEPRTGERDQRARHGRERRRQGRDRRTLWLLRETGLQLGRRHAYPSRFFVGVQCQQHRYRGQLRRLGGGRNFLSEFQRGVPLAGGTMAGIGFLPVSSPPAVAERSHSARPLGSTPTARSSSVKASTTPSAMATGSCGAAAAACRPWYVLYNPYKSAFKTGPPASAPTARSSSEPRRQVER
jgi:hypothetical protein